MRGTATALFVSAGVFALGCSLFPESPPVVHGTGTDGGGGRGLAEASAAGGGGAGGASAVRDAGGGDTGSSVGPDTGLDAAAGGSGSVVDAATGGGGSVVDAATGGGGSVVDAATGGSGSVVDAATGGSGSVVDAATTDGGSAIDAGPSRRVYSATVADCLEATLGKPNPDACLTYATTNDGPNEVWVAPKLAPNLAFTGYLRFDVDGAIAGHVVTSVRVEITVTSYPNAPGNAPQVWQVTAFDRAQLFVATPSLVGASALAPSPGVLVNGATAAYSIPTSLVAANAAVYLGLVPTGTNGSGFWNGAGATPPRLVVEYR